MHIAYSAFRSASTKGKSKINSAVLLQRYEGYRSACQKYEQQIAEIQRYIPGWVPPFETKPYYIAQ